jgi:ribonuclease P protein component
MIVKKLKLPINLFPKNAKTVFRNKYFILKSNPNNLFYDRLGVVISKRVLKSAAARNCLRRKIFDFFRSSYDFENPSNKNKKDLLIIINPAIIELTKSNLKNKLEELYEFSF